MRQKYYSIEKIKRTDSDYNIILGERSNGKSYAVKHECLKAAIKNDREKFIYLRRWDVDIKPSYVESYFGDVDISGLTDGEYDGIVLYQRNIYLAFLDEKTNKLKKDKLIGYARALTQNEHYKSGVYTDCKNIIYEEFITSDSYLPNEPTRLMQFISTVARRNKIKVWLVGNTISRVCPYFDEWELYDIPKQQPGTIDIYDRPTNQIDENGSDINVRIAVEFAENSGNNSKMFFGDSAKMIVDSVWHRDNKPKPIRKISEYKVVYTIVFEHKGFKFLCRFMADMINKGYFWYVSPKTTNVQKGTRLITDRLIVNNYSTKSLYPLNAGEKIMFDYMLKENVYYSDDLTGTDFEVCLRENLRNAKIFVR